MSSNHQEELLGVKPDQVIPERTLPDPFDIERLRLTQDFEERVGVKKVTLVVPVRKPPKQSFIRVRPGAEWRMVTAVVELKEEREVYLVAPDLWSSFPGELVQKLLLTAVDRMGTVFLWPVALPGKEGRPNPWSQSALEAAKHAEEEWVRVVPNMSAGGYEVYMATGELGEPVWPEGKTFQELLDIAFKHLKIADETHPVLRKLQGAT